jgi:hypothetical protein
MFLSTNTTYIDLGNEKEYVTKTKDGEVSEIGSVLIEESVTLKRTIVHSLSEINKQISTTTNQIANLETDLDELNALKTVIETKATKVTLK